MSAPDDEEEDVETFTFDPLIVPNTVNVGGEQRLPVEIDGRRHTVRARGIRSFETSIIRELKDPEGEGRQLRESPSGNERRGSAIPIKGRWIHDWLEGEGEDYINNIFRNWLFFIKALELRTKRDRERSENPSSVVVFNRSPGTYDSMYRFLMLLVEQDVLVRRGTQRVPAEEYDIPVPEEFRTRSFLAVNKSYDEARRIWENPYRSQYPEAYGDLKEPEPEPEPEEVEPEEPLPEAPEEPEEEREIPEPSGLEVPDGLVSVDDFPELLELRDFINDNAEEALDVAVEQTNEETPDVPGREINREDIEIGRTLIVGPWAVGEARAGQDPLSLFMSVRTSVDRVPPTALVNIFAGVLSTLLNQNNRYPEWFTSYDVGAAFSRDFTTQLAAYLASNDFNRQTAYNLNARSSVSTNIGE